MDPSWNALAFAIPILAGVGGAALRTLLRLKALGRAPVAVEPARGERVAEAEIQRVVHEREPEPQPEPGASRSRAGSPRRHAAISEVDSV